MDDLYVTYLKDLAAIPADCCSAEELCTYFQGT